MSTGIAERTVAKTPIVLSVTDETIEQMSQRMLTLKVNGINDKQGYELVDAARKECVKARTSIDKVHKELKAESLKYCQELDAEKRRLTAKVEAIEGHLQDELDVVKKEQARIKKEQEDATYAIRLKMLTAAGGFIPEAVIRSMNDEAFARAVEEASLATQRRKEAEAKAAAEEAERKRIAAEQAEANRIEAERLAAERAEFQRQQAEQAAERKRLQDIEDAKLAEQRAELEAQRQEQARQAAELKAEQDRLAKVEADRLAAIEQERVAAETAERVRVETEARLKREAELAELDRQAKAAAEKRALELRPAKAKLNSFAHSVINLEVPHISDDVDRQVQSVLNQAAELIRKIGASLS